MQSFGILNADRSESTPTKMAYLIGVSIIDYVDRCFPEVEGSFSEIVDGITAVSYTHLTLPTSDLV